MATRRLELGFEGGTVLKLTVDAAVAEGFTSDLAAGKGPAWSAIESDEGTFWVNQGELVYVRLPQGEAPARVGFGGS